MTGWIERNVFIRWLIVAAIASVYLWLSINSAIQKSMTVDEKIHLAGGYSYLLTRDFRIDPEHPPLMKYVAALPLLFIKPILPVEDNSWAASDTLGFGRVFMYEANSDYESILMPARMMLIIWSLLTFYIVYTWSCELWGYAGGLFSMILYAFCPNILAHCGLVATDFGAASFSLFIFYTAYNYWQKPDRYRLTVLAMVSALAICAKYSLLSMLPLVAAVIVLRSIINSTASSHRLRSISWNMAVWILGVSIMIFLVYARLDAPKIFFSGLHGLNARMESGHAAFLMGQYSDSGWYHYFAIAFLFKTPVLVLLLLIGSLIFGFKSGRGLKPGAFTLLPAFFYFSIASLSRHNIGIRHILPIYPLLYVWLGVWVSRISPLFRFRFLTCCIQLILAGSLAIDAFPDYLSFFNVLAGGKNGGYRFLNDSNLDWGQDLKALKSYLERNPPDGPLYIDYFGDRELLAYYKFDYRPAGDFEHFNPVDGTIAVSIFNLANVRRNPKSRFDWLQYYEPEFKIGGSIWVYTTHPFMEAPEKLLARYCLPQDIAITGSDVERYLRSGWKKGDPDGDWVFPVDPDRIPYRAVEPVASIAFSVPKQMNHRMARLNFDLYFTECLDNSFQQMECRLNGKFIERMVLQNGWQSFSMDLPRLSANSLNLLEFVSRDKVIPAEYCPVEKTIGRSGKEFPVNLFMRSGKKGNTQYWNLTIGDTKLRPVSAEGYSMYEVDETGRMLRSWIFTPRDLEAESEQYEVLASAMDENHFLLGIGYKESSFRLHSSFSQSLRKFGVSGDLNELINGSHLFIGSRQFDPGTAEEKLSDRVIFIFKGSNHDTQPFYFGISRIQFLSALDIEAE